MRHKDLITLICTGMNRLNDDEGNDMAPPLFFFTSSGRIGTISDLPDDLAMTLDALQRNMEELVHGPGEMSHATFVALLFYFFLHWHDISCFLFPSRWRAPSTMKGMGGTTSEPSAVGFLDGDYLQKFSDFGLGSEQVESILAGKNDAERLQGGYDELVNALDALQSLQ